MEPRHSWARRWLPWLIPLLVVLAAIIVAVMMLRGGGSGYYVPQVNNEPVSQALSQIRAAGLNPVTIDQPSATVAKDHVIRTSPAEGNAVSKGQTITVYVSSGPANILLPNVANLQGGAAQAKLNNLGFTNVTQQPDPQSTLPQGEVDHMTPAPGSKYAPNTQITLYVSGGGVKVPQLVNIPVTSATQTLAGYNLQWKIEYSPGPAGTPPGMVWNSIPQQGATVPQGYRVILQVQPQATASPSPSPSVSATPTTSPPTTPPPTTPPPTTPPPTSSPTGHP